MFSAVLLSVSLEKTQLPLSMNLLSNQKLDENTVKHRPNLFHYPAACTLPISRNLDLKEFFKSGSESRVIYYPRLFILCLQ